MLILILKYHKLEIHPMATCSSFETQLNVPKSPNMKTVYQLIDKFLWTDNMADDLVENISLKKTIVTSENVAIVSGFNWQNSRKSIQRIATEIGLKHFSTQRILRNNLHMFSFKIQSHQSIPIQTVRQRTDIANQILRMIDSEEFDVSHIHRWCTVSPEFICELKKLVIWVFWKSPVVWSKSTVFSQSYCVYTISCIFFAQIGSWQFTMFFSNCSLSKLYLIQPAERLSVLYKTLQLFINIL